MRPWLLSLLLIATSLVRPSAAAEWLDLQAEHFQGVETECRNFGGVVGVHFPKKESVVRTSFDLARPVEAEIWARVYFPWARQDALNLQIDGRSLTLTARNATSGGRWEIGNYQVWHWLRAGTASLTAGKHTLEAAPVNGVKQRLDRVVLYWGREPAWTQPWLADGADLARASVAWDRGSSLVVAAPEFRQPAPEVESSGGRRVAVLRADGDRMRTTFSTARPARVQLWARVYFEAKNMFEGLTMQELSNNLYISLDGELVKTVYEQNGRQWHWVATDEFCDLQPGTHLIALQKQGLPVKVDQVVVYSGDGAPAEPWFRAPPPPSLAFGFDAAPEIARAGSWRAHGTATPPAMSFLGEQDGPAPFPMKVAMGPECKEVDLVRIVGLADNPLRGDRTPGQQIGLWMKNTGLELGVEILYSDRHGECFLQSLGPARAWTGWRYLAATVPLVVKAGETFFDGTGEAADTAMTPLAAPQGASPGPSGVCCAGGDRNAAPDFPLEVRGLRLSNARGAGEIRFGEPRFDSPFNLRIRIPNQSPEETAFEVEVHNRDETERLATVHHRFGSGLGDLLDAGSRSALLERHEMPVPGRGKAALRLTLPAAAGIHFLECCVGPDAPLRRYVAFGETWQGQLAAQLRQAEQAAGALRCSPDGADRPLKKPDGTPLRPDEVRAVYGPGKGLVVTDGGLDVCSLAYAARRDYAYPLQPRALDLSDEAGWPHVRVPYGVLAIDPALGRVKFAEADASRLALHSAVQTGFGVPGPRVTVRGRFAYVGPGEGQYSIVDCDDRSRPRVVSHISSWYFSYGLLPLRDKAYFEPSHRGLVLADDLSNPYQPGPLRSVHFSRGRYGRLAQVFEDEAVGYSLGGPEPALAVFDLADPLYPRQIGKVEGIAGLFLCGRHALVYVDNQVRLLDVSNPRLPRLLPGGIDRRVPVQGGKADGKVEMAGVLALSAEHVALRARKQIDVYRYRAGSSLVAEKMLSLEIPEKSGRHVFGAFHRGLLYVIDGKDGPGQYSLGAKSPASRWFVFELDKGRQVGFYEHPWPSAFGSISITGDTAYVADYNYGLWLFDLAQPRAPKRLGGAVTAGESDALWIDGERAYQWQTFGGAVFLLDIAQPGNPKRLGEYWDGAWLPYGNSRRSNHTVAGKDGFLYVPRQAGGLLVVDVRDPAKPQRLGEFKDQEGLPLKVYGACIDVWGDRAMVLAAKKLLLVYDVSRPDQPRLVSTLPIPDADLLCAKADRLYLGHAKGGLTVVDLADPARPAVLSTLDLGPYCPVKMGEVISGLAAAKGHVYLTGRGPRSAGGNFLHVVDVRDGRQPRWVKTFQPKPDMPESPCSLWADFYQDIIADGDYLFVGDYGEIQCLDIREPSQPRMFDALHAGYQWSVGRKRGPHLFVPALSGLMVLRAPSSSQRPIGPVKVAN